MTTRTTHPVAAPVALARSRTGARRWAWFTLAFFIVVVLEGAVVRATSSGAGCGAHWPLCNGEILPHHPRLATIIEFTHRSLTGVSSMCFAVLVAWTFLVTPKRHPARRAAVISTVLLLTEAILGALLVLNHWVENNASTARVIAQSVHFTNTLMLLGATTLTAVLLGRPDPISCDKTLQRSTWLALAATVVTGATGSLAALADTIFPSPDLRTALAADFAQNSPLLIRMRWMHPAAALVATVCTVLMVTALRRQGQRRSASLLAWNVAAQIAIGVADVLLLAPITLQVLHLLSADLFWIALAVIGTPILLPHATERAGMTRTA